MPTTLDLADLVEHWHTAAFHERTPELEAQLHGLLKTSGTQLAMGGGRLATYSAGPGGLVLEIGSRTVKAGRK